MNAPFVARGSYMSASFVQGLAVETTTGFNRLKPPRPICQKVVITGQYESEWSIENFKWTF